MRWRGTTWAGSLGGAVVLACLILGMSSPGAGARVADNPCPDVTSDSVTDLETGRVYTGNDIYGVPERHRVLMCDTQIGITGWTTRDNGRATCPKPYKLAGTSLNHRLPSTAHWDFWTRNGEWVTWTGGGGFTGEENVPGGTQVGGFSPHLHNWAFPAIEDSPNDPNGRGIRPARVFAYCDEYGSRPRPSDDDEQVIPERRDGAEGEDEMPGTAGDDELRGHKGDDQESGGTGDDLILGGAGDDNTSGGRGDDELFDDHGRDQFWGGPGDDHFSAHDGDTDNIHCGPGKDIVYADPHDDISADCERAHVIGQVPEGDGD